MQDCSNGSYTKAEISLHKSPIDKISKRIWINFVKTKRANFNPGEARFMVCSDHFSPECFERSYHLEGSMRHLKLDSIPAIWKKPTISAETSSRQGRKASEYKTFREVYRITVIHNKTRRKANIRYIIHARLRFFIDRF